MKLKTLSIVMKLAVLFVAICGALFFAVVLRTLFIMLPVGYTATVVSYIVMVVLIAISCYAILVFVWKTSSAISRDNAFTFKVANYINKSAILLVAIAVVFALLMATCTITMPLFFYFTVPTGLGGSAVIVMLAFFAFILSHYVKKAADLRETSEGTI